MAEAEISRTEIKQELLQRAQRYSNVLVWILLFVYPLFSIADFLLLEEYWKLIFQVRLVLIVIIYLVYFFTNRFGWHPNVPLYVSLSLVSLQIAALMPFVDTEDMRIYFLFFSSLFIVYNSIAMWRQWIAFLIYGFAAGATILAFYLWGGDDASAVLNNGGYMFLVSAFFSCVIPGIRHRSVHDSIRQQIQLKSSFDQLRVQNEEMRYQREKIEKFTQQKNNMLRIARHDLKNTSGAIYSLTSLALEDVNKGINKGEMRETLQMTNEAAKKMIYLIDQLLVPFDYQDTSINFNFETVEFISEVKSVLHALRPLADSKNVVLDEQHPPETILIRADRVYFSIIVRNLLNYAIRLSQNNNQIHITSGRQYNRAFFEVVDKTRGIDKAELDEMFNRMQSLEEASNVHDASQGIGLSVARLLTSNMGGKLEYASSRELGIQFRVEFNVF